MEALAPVFIARCLWPTGHYCTELEMSDGAVIRVSPLQGSGMRFLSWIVDGETLIERKYICTEEAIADAVCEYTRLTLDNA